jgi:hypothetical protein
MKQEQQQKFEKKFIKITILISLGKLFDVVIIIIVATIDRFLKIIFILLDLNRTHRIE